MTTPGGPDSGWGSPSDPAAPQSPGWASPTAPPAQPSPGWAPPPPPAAPGWAPPSYPAGGGYGYGGGTQEHPQGTMILIFGILGFVVCFIFGIVAWVMGGKALKEIDAAPGRYSNRSTVNAGRICGIISTCLALVGIVIYAVLIIAVIGSSSTS